MTTINLKAARRLLEIAQGDAIRDGLQCEEEIRDAIDCVDAALTWGDKTKQDEPQSSSLARELADLESKLKPLLDLHRTMLEKQQQHREMLSREFIAANRITRDQIETSNGDGKPWFNTVYEFGDWLASNSTKRWAEWNGRIYHAADLVSGMVPADMPGKMEHLPNDENYER